MKRGNKKKSNSIKINKEKLLIIIGILCILLLLLFVFNKILFPPKNWYQDSDGDTFGNKTITINTRFKPNGYVKDNTDIDDNDYCVPVPKESCLNTKDSSNKKFDDTINKPIKGSSNDPVIKKPPIKTIPKDNKGSTKPVSSVTPTKKNDSLQPLPVISKDYTEYYFDEDGDGMGDPNTSKEFSNSQNISEQWVSNSKGFDRCPQRKAINEPDGCPKPTINNLSEELYYGDVFSVTPTIETIAGDKFDWTSDSKTKIISKNSKTGSFEINDYGLTTINFNISNADGYNESTSIKVLGRISNQDLENRVRDNIIEVGQYDPGTSVNVKINSKADKARSFILSLCDSETKVSEKGLHYGNNVGSFIDAKILTKGSYVTDVKVNSIEYDEKKGLISSIDIELIKYGEK